MWRWMPPEMLTSALSSSQSSQTQPSHSTLPSSKKFVWSRACDVWQFGACMFELQSLSSLPERIVPFLKSKSANDLLKVFENCEKRNSPVPLNFSEVHRDLHLFVVSVVVAVAFFHTVTGTVHSLQNHEKGQQCQFLRNHFFVRTYDSVQR